MAVIFDFIEASINKLRQDLLSQYGEDDEICQSCTWDDWAYQVEIATISLEGLCDDGMGFSQAADKVRECLSLGAFTPKAMQTVSSIFEIVMGEIEQCTEAE